MIRILKISVFVTMWCLAYHSSPASAACMKQFQVMACCQIGTKPLAQYLNQCWLIDSAVLWSCIMYFLNCAANKDMFNLNLKYSISWLICLLRCIKIELNWIGIERKWIELELNWKILNPIWIGIELNWKIRIQLELELNWIERNELIRALNESNVH